MKILKNVLVVLVTIILSILIAPLFGKLYSVLFNPPAGFFSFYAPESLYNFFDGVFIAYIFFLTLLFTSFGGAGKTKYGWIGILLIPALALEVYLDLAHIYFPIILALLGWVLGFGIRKLVVTIRNKNKNVSENN